MEIKNRYDREHQYGEVKFFLEDFKPTTDQCRYLMLKVLEQAVRDYCSLSDSKIASEQVAWQLSKDFLFDNNYLFMWGDMELTFEAFLDLIDLDVHWVRNQTHKKFERGKHGKKR